MIYQNPRLIAAADEGAYAPAMMTQAETVAAIAAMVNKPTLKHALRIDTLIAALKTAGAWTDNDLLYLTMAHDRQAMRLNLINPTGANSLAEVGAPNFIPFRGVSSTGAVVDYFTSNLAMNAATQFQQNANGFGNCCLLHGNGTGNMGTDTTAIVRLWNADSPNCHARITNNSSATAITTTAKGTRHCDRSTNLISSVTADGVQGANQGNASSARDASKFTLLWAFGTAVSCTDLIGMAWFSTTRDATRRAAVRAAFTAYANSIRAEIFA